MVNTIQLLIFYYLFSIHSWIHSIRFEDLLLYIGIATLVLFCFFYPLRETSGNSAFMMLSQAMMPRGLTRDRLML